MSATAESLDLSFQTILFDEDLKISEPAQLKMAELISDVNNDDIAGIRIFVNGGGCGGMSYGMTFADQIQDMDISRDYSGFKIIVDAMAINFLRGSDIDYISDSGNERFVFNNVFRDTGGAGTCGACGSAGGGCG